MQYQNFLSNDELQKAAPAIFQERAASGLTERYSPVSTLAAIDALAKGGWHPVGAEQKKTRNSNKAIFAKHLVRFRRSDSQVLLSGGAARVGQAIPEIVLLNSHNGTSSYRLLAGLHVLACANGLIVADKTLASVVVRHLKCNEPKLLEAAEKIAANLKPVVERVEAMSRTELVEAERKEFARAALRIKFPKGGAPFTSKDLLVPRRKADARNDLWAVFNVVQENIMAGGLVGKTASGRRFTSSPVRDINIKVDANQALWGLADEFLARRN